ncbi:MAG: indolepyruvate ferredoxin oxidoreductase family protein [Solirubrobacterales bacterium]
MSGRPSLPAVGLDDKYEATAGPVLISGIQALARIPLDQRRLDAARGLETGGFVSGYQGSPLGGLDRELVRARRQLDAAGVVFRPGVNEELAATAVAGTQLLGQLERRLHEGVTGYWFGKNPGLDRAADAIRHATLSGTAPLGGAVAWIGDDPGSKSSTVPSSCEPMCRSLLLPLLAPGSVREILSLGLHAVALSREAGLWSGLKIVADIADATAVVRLDGLLDEVPAPRPREAGAPPVLLPPTNLVAEEELMTERLARAAAYARRAGLNRIVSEPRRPRTALLAAGIGYQSLLRAFADLGLDEAARDALGLRLVQISMPWPLDAESVRELCGGVETVLVVEDKLPFLESQIKEALYGETAAPRVLGKHDAEGAPLLSPRSSLSVEEISRALASTVGAARLPEPARRHLERLERRPGAGSAGPLPRRTPYFCSGCPHNVSTRARPDQLVGVGIGCHIMVAIDGGDRRGELLGMPQMGGEGAQWLGLESFTEDDHFIQNIGDGTFHHSGSLAIRAAVAADAHMTFRLLYNDAVAMTGGQRAEGRLSVPDLTRWLATEGVSRVIVTTPEPRAYRGIQLDPIASVRHRDRIEAAQEELAATAGVTVLVHDDRCATEKRRLRKRGKLPTPPERVWINERVCEGCGDCGEQSTCLSLLPVETEFGRKTRIHQSSCNQDMTCLKGDCPSFLLVTPGSDRPPVVVPPELPVDLAEPSPHRPREVLVRMLGIGGTGVVTVSQVLQMAARLDGRYAAGLEQIGLAQKGGPVVSDLRFADQPVEGSLRASAGAADLILGFDLLGAAGAETLAVADPERTVAVLNTALTPTAEMVTDVDAAPPSTDLPLRRLEAATRREEMVKIDAERLAERLFGDHMPANMILVGVAFQHGCLPLSAAAVEAAIELNGAAVEKNLAAFTWGRAAVAAPEAVERALAVPEEELPLDPRAAAIVTASGAGPELGAVLERRVSELIAYQGPACARGYAEDVARLAAAARERAGSDADPVAEAYSRNLFKLIAYKDEYEVARLHLDPRERARREREFGPDAKVQILLHPPLLRALGLHRKLRVGRWATPALRLLAAMRRLRGSRLDPFGYARVRRVERRLPGEYRLLVEDAVARLEPGNVDLVTEVAALPDLIRGYEEIKLSNVERFCDRAAELERRLRDGDAETAVPLLVIERAS